MVVLSRAATWLAIDQVFLGYLQAVSGLNMVSVDSLLAWIPNGSGRSSMGGSYIGRLAILASSKMAKNST